MVTIRRLLRRLNRLTKRLDLDEIPLASLLFFVGCLVLALIGYISWRSDHALLTNGREIRARVIDRQTKTTEDCDDDGCTTEISHYLTYQYTVQDQTFTEEQLVDRDIYERAESTIPIRYHPDRPSTSNVAQTVENTLPFPLFSIIALFIGLLGAAIIYLVS
jgi:hypothetical protein